MGEGAAGRRRRRAGAGHRREVVPQPRPGRGDLAGRARGGGSRLGARAPPRDEARLEEGRRAGARGRHDRDLRGSTGLMALRKYKPTSPGRRFMTVSTFEEVTKSKPEKSLVEPVTKKGGRNNKGRIT